MRTLAQWVMEYALNAAWQVPLVFATAWLVVRLGRRSGPVFEHRVWVGALMMEAVLPACSVSPTGVLREIAAFVSSFTRGHVSKDAQVTVTIGPVHAQGGLHIAHFLLVGVAVLYGCTFLVFAVRLGLGLSRTSLLRQRAKFLALTGEAGRGFERCARLFEVENVLVAASKEIAGPVTVGVRRQVLLLPTGLDADTQMEDLDAVFAHEFAHMRRKDFAKNLLYQVLSLPIAFHPLVWMTRTRLAESREMVCDAMAADAVAGRQEYARSLLRLAANFSGRTQLATFHAIGIFDANHFGNFERRIMNLTTKRIELPSAGRVAVAAVGLVIGCGACASALALRVQVAAPAQAAQTTSQTPLPQSFVMSVPRSATGTPAPTMKVELLPSPMPVVEAAAAPAPSPSPMRIRVLTPAHLESDASQTQTPTIQEDDHISRVAGDVIAGNIETRVTPVYPQAAKDAKIQGTVVLDAVIGKDGNLRALKLVSGPEELARSAWEAVTRWTYKPYLLNGQPTEVETTITVNYHLAQ